MTNYDQVNNCYIELGNISAIFVVIYKQHSNSTKWKAMEQKNKSSAEVSSTYPS